MDTNEEYQDLLNLDIVFPHLPDFGKFNINEVIPPGVSFDYGNLIYPANTKIAKLLSKHGYAAISKERQLTFMTYFAELSEKGRDAKAAGGHFAYLKELADKKDKEQKRQHNKDLIDRVDLFIKQWTYKSRLFPYLASFSAVVVSTLVYINQRNKQTDLLQVQQEIQVLKQKMKTQDSLFQVNTPLKKDTSHKPQN